MNWTTFNDKEVDVYQFLRDNMGPNRKVIIGTDSQRAKKRKRKHGKGNRKVKFCTIIAIVEEGTGRECMRKAIRKVLRTDPFPSLYERLMHEVWLSIDTANELCGHKDDPTAVNPDSGLCKADIELHIDVNPSSDWESGQYKAPLTGYALGSGYGYQIKPDAWGASAVADAQVR